MLQAHAGIINMCMKQALPCTQVQHMSEPQHYDVYSCVVAAVLASPWTVQQLFVGRSNHARDQVLPAHW